MRVLFATYPMAFQTPGGGEMQLLAYERHLPEHGVEVMRFDMWSPQFSSCDLVHFFSCIGGSSHFCAYVKQLGLPLVVTSSLWITEATKSNFPVGEITHQLGLADCVVTNSRRESQTLSEVLGIDRRRFSEVANAVEEQFFMPAESGAFRRAYDLQRPFVLCVANIEPRKNQLALLEAMRAYPDLDLVLLGHIRDEDYWLRVKAEGGTQLRYLGAIEPNSALLSSAYADCAVFVLPSLFETPGLAALEAAAQRAPVVITAEGPTREYFGVHADYVDPFSVPSISKGIQHALQRGRTSPFRPPRWRDATADLARIYRNLVSADDRTL